MTTFVVSCPTRHAATTPHLRLPPEAVQRGCRDGGTVAHIQIFAPSPQAVPTALFIRDVLGWQCS
jgi:hypothetical protein